MKDVNKYRSKKSYLSVQCEDNLTTTFLTCFNSLISIDFNNGVVVLIQVRKKKHFDFIFYSTSRILYMHTVTFLFVLILQYIELTWNKINKYDTFKYIRPVKFYLD